MRASQRTLRPLLLGLALSGLAISLRMPLFALLAKVEIGARLEEIAAITSCATALSIAVSLVIGRASDRARSRTGLIALSAAWMAAGSLALALSRNVHELFAASLLFLPLAAIPGGQLLALGRSVVESDGAAGADHASGPEAASARLRSAASVGFFFGPLIGAGLCHVAGVRLALALAGVPYLALIALIALRRDPKPRPSMPPATPAALNRGDWRRLLFFVAAMALVLAAEYFRAGFLTIFAVEELHASPEASAAIFSVPPIANILLMPTMGKLADRFGTARVTACGAFAGVVWCGLSSIATSFVALALIQLVYAFYASCVLAVGLGFAHEQAQRNSGMGIGAFQASTGVAALLGSGLGGWFSSAFGLRAGFRAGALACFLGATLVLALGARDRSRR